MTEQAKRKAGRPVTGATKHIHTITLEKGLLDAIKTKEPSFKLSSFVNKALKAYLSELNS
jgi:uncharacterized protein (DUF4415 family)